MEIIVEREQLVALAARLGVRPDWHEPDEQEVTAKTFGRSFDNAGFWGSSHARYMGRSEEQHVVLYQNDSPVAAVNLATLFAWASGLDE